MSRDDNILERLESLEDLRDEVQVLRQSVQTQARVVSDMNTRLSNVQHIADGSEIADLRTKQRHLAHDVDSILEINRGILSRLDALENTIRHGPPEDAMGWALTLSKRLDKLESEFAEEKRATDYSFDGQRDNIEALEKRLSTLDATVRDHDGTLVSINMSMDEQVLAIEGMEKRLDGVNQKGWDDNLKAMGDLVETMRRVESEVIRRMEAIEEGQPKTQEWVMGLEKRLDKLKLRVDALSWAMDLKCAEPPESPTGLKVTKTAPGTLVVEQVLTDADVTRAYERGIAEGRRRELRRVREWAQECESANQDATRDAKPDSANYHQHIGHVHAMQAVARKMLKWLRDANGEEAKP